MDIVYDVTLKTLTIDTAAAKPCGADLTAKLNRYGQDLVLKGLSFGVDVTIDGATVSYTFPPAGAKYTATNQDVLTVVRAYWQSDDDVTVYAWITLPSGTIEATETFTAPRPAQPYPSWTWVDGRWTPPVAYPDDGSDYTWDEAGQAWVAV